MTQTGPTVVVTGLTAARMLEIENESVVGGLVGPDGRLLLSTRGGTEIDAGDVRGPEGTGPTGTISMFAAAAAPAGWLICDGSALDRGVYSTLFAVIGTTYGAGDGSTTFNLPNLKGRVPVGADPAQTEFDQLGESGGEKTHVLSASEMPSHTHLQNSHTHTQDPHTHIQQQHLHTTGTHSHTQNAHGHSPNAHNHDTTDGNSGFQSYLSGNAGRTWVATGTSANRAAITGATTDGIGYSGIQNQYGTVDANTPTNNSASAGTANYTTAVNNSSTATNQSATATNQNTGGGAAHNNLQPYVVLNYIIKT